jgi:hypothetical protein
MSRADPALRLNRDVSHVPDVGPVVSLGIILMFTDSSL